LREQIAAIESGKAEALLAKKEKELDALRVEVDQLRKLARRVPQIAISFQVFEFSRTRLEAAKIPQTQFLFPKGGDKVQPPVVYNVANAAAAKEAVEALRKKELLKILAEPTLVTISGRQALFHSGGEFPVTLPQPQGTTSLEYRKFGTQIEALPMLVGGGKVRIHVRAKVSEIDAARTVKVNGSEIPGLRERAVDTAAELRFGEALVLSGLVQVRIQSQVDAKGKTQTGSDEFVTVFVITPEQVDPQETAIFPHPVGTYHGSYGPAPSSSKATQPNSKYDFFVPVPTAAKPTQPKSRK
jgi:Flp pilus assembly secretin CpaC